MLRRYVIVCLERSRVETNGQAGSHSPCYHLFFLGLQFVCLSLFTSPRLFPAGQSDEVAFYFNLGCTDCLTPRKGFWPAHLLTQTTGKCVEAMSWYKRVHESTKYRRFETEEVVDTKQSGDIGGNRRKFWTCHSSIPVLLMTSSRLYHTANICHLRIWFTLGFRWCFYS